MGLPHTLINAPPKFPLSDFHAHILQCLSSLSPYHQYIELVLQQRLIRCLVKYGFVTRCAKQCITALTVVTLEMQEAMVKLLPEVLLDLSKMSATIHIAVPILEFLSSKLNLFYFKFYDMSLFISSSHYDCFGFLCLKKISFRNLLHCHIFCINHIKLAFEY